MRILQKGMLCVRILARITFTEKEATTTCYFANMAGFGFDAMVAAKTNRLKDKGRSGISLYLQALSSSFLNYQTTKIHIIIDGKVIDELIFSVSIAIGKFNGGGMMQAPEQCPIMDFFWLLLFVKLDCSEYYETLWDCIPENILKILGFQLFRQRIFPSVRLMILL